MKRAYLILLLLLYLLKASGQGIEVKSKLQVTSFIANDKVFLRWAPENAISWQLGNKYGYSIYRKVIVRNGIVIENADSILIGKICPLPIESWEPFADSSYFAVAAEAIYGTEFNVTTQSNSFLDIVNKSREQDSRFTIGLLCADQSFNVACMMGLGLIDATIKKNESYLYKVVTNFVDSLKTGVGYSMVDVEYGNFIPRPFGITYQLNNNAVTILVPYEPFKSIYSNYELQRSYDGFNYFTIKDHSFYSLSTSPDDPKFSIYTDSVELKESTVYYRLRGRTPFDTYGPFSDSLIVKVRPSLCGEPWITELIENGLKNLCVKWETPSYNMEYLKGYKIFSSKSIDGPYSNVLDSLVDPNIHFRNIVAPEGYAYIKVAAFDRFDRSYYSAPMLYQAIDSIPPSAPVGLKGSFDTTGVVTLKWALGKEKDLLCYQALYSSNVNSEFSLISKEFIYDSIYKTSFSTEMLSSEMFFKIVALDTRYNTSQPSEVLKLIKPDRIPPSAPAILVDTDSTFNVKVTIAPSSSSDVVLHKIYYISDNDINEIEVLKACITKDTSFVLGNEFSKGELYCVAVDITGRKGYSNRVRINQAAGDQKSPLSIIVESSIDDNLIKVSWNPSEIIGSIMIYRKVDTNSYSLVATIDSKCGVFIDRDVIFNTKYKYKFIAFSSKGKATKREIEMFYK